ncbi:MAG: hypothetical protein WB696_13525 [Chthoniobacterales bacterium]
MVSVAFFEHQKLERFDPEQRRGQMLALVVSQSPEHEKQIGDRKLRLLAIGYRLFHSL